MKTINILSKQSRRPFLWASRISTLVGLLLLAGCVKDMQPGVIESGKEVSARIALQPDPEAPFAEPTAGTRGADDTSVNDIWVLQFNGEGKDALLVSPPRYYDDPAQGVRLLSGPKQRIVVVANMGNRYFNFMLTQGVSNYQDFLDLASDPAISPVQILTCENDIGSLTMEGSVVQDIRVNEDAPLVVPIKYCVARIELTLTNAGGSGLTITGVQLRGVSASLDALAPEAKYSEADPPVTFPAASRTNSWIDYDRQDLDLAPGTTAFTRTWYTPRNERGTVDAVTTNAQKAQYAQYMGDQIITTCIEVSAVTAAGSPRTYRFLAGANSTTDYNIKPGCRYTAALTFYDEGNVGVDMRIVDYRKDMDGDVEVIDYVKDAGGAELAPSNCYILNPPLTGKRVYLIPVNRADDYWNQPKEGGYQAEGDFSDVAYRISTVSDGQGFGTELLWQDRPDMVEPRHIVGGRLTNVGSANWPANGKKTICVTHACGGYSVADRTQNYIEITVPAGAQCGNFLLGIYSADVNFMRVLEPVEQLYSWSLHFWVTDYMPGEAQNVVNGTHGEYIVPGGHVHRYAGTTWTGTGEYANKVIMDRNIGMNGTDLNTALTNTALYYQYGRKDPFPMRATLYDENNGPVTLNVADGPVTINEAVKHPTTIYASPESWWAYGNGTSTTIEDGTLYLWQDTKVLKTAVGVKSFFDPSPYGWALPKNTAFTNFNITVDSNGLGTTNGNATQSRFPDYATAQGIYYWPTGVDVNGCVFIPGVGRYLTNTAGTLVVSNATYTYLWSSISANASNGILALYGYTGYTTNSTGIERRSFAPVRAVEH